MKTDRSIYWRKTLPSIKRLISMIDRDPLSPSYGSFDREYWLYRTHDFSSHIRQQGIHSLAILWSLKQEDNPYYQSQAIYDWCIAGVDFLIGQQHNDGSFDEWYPNERGWAGPTGYLLHSLCSTFRLLSKNLKEDQKDRFIKAISKSAHFLGESWEPDVLSNHIAMALLPIYESYEITQDKKIYNLYQKLFKKFLGYWEAEEGWSLEYDGADIGYQTATLSFLARLHKRNKSQNILNLIPQSLEFISHFYFPNSEFANKLGSRQTIVNFVYAMEYWSDYFPLAARMAKENRLSLEKNISLVPADHDDHYFIYRLPEFLESHLIPANSPTLDPPPLLPYERESFQKHFTKSDFLIINNEKCYIVINLKRGGATQVYSKEKGSWQNMGWFLKDKSHSTFASSVIHESPIYEINKESVLIHGAAQKVKHHRFTPFKMILFRTFMITFSRHKWVATKIKQVIRQILLYGSKQNAISFTREICWSEKINVTDTIFCKTEKIRHISYQSNSEVRFVPQSRYFQLSDLKQTPQSINPKYLKVNENKKSFSLKSEF